MSASTASRSWIKPLAVAAVVAALAAGGYAFVGKDQPAPEVTYFAINGEKLSTQSLKGKVVMVNFWATSCATCVKEMPGMVDTYNKYKGQGLEFIAVAMQYDPPNYVLNFAETRQLPFKVALDSGGNIAKSFGNVVMTPTTFVIDKDGKIIKRYVGEPEWSGLHKLLEKSLAG